DHGAADLRRDLHQVALHVGVVGGFVMAGDQRVVGTVACAEEQHGGGNRGERLAARAVVVAVVCRGLGSIHGVGFPEQVSWVMSAYFVSAATAVVSGAGSGA